MPSTETENVIAIDGPAGSGKSTVAQAVARRLGIRFIDSGSMYRVVTLVALEREISLDDENGLAIVASEIHRDYKLEVGHGEAPRIKLGQRDVTGEIRSGAVDGAVSPVSRHRAVREEMSALQRDLASDGTAVVEGRDIGTAVFPGARLKIYLDASAGERARRRYAETYAMGSGRNGQEIEEEIRRRDFIDSSRTLSPLSASPDAYKIDTTEKTIEEVTEEIVNHARSLGLHC